ncbi:hypothetical protein Leryth_002097 [Lithospermum erythrorhizon]|nr:hypothetical protein Leryth_002097 [Lithospermum erythrorhizon]
MPHGICLSANELKPPSRVFLMSILVVATRVYYNINGFGKWESTMSKSSSSLPRGKLNGKENNTFGFDLGSDAQEEDFVPNISSKDYEVHESDVGELLHILDEKFNKLCELHDNFAHYKDLPSYLQFCKDGVFAGVKPSLETCEEEKLIEEVWEFYQKDSKSSKNGINRPGEDEVCTPAGCKTPQGDGNACDTCKNAHNEGATRSIKRDMEDNKFVYVPPRSKVQRDDHIYYCRKKNDGAYIFAVHGDYYILLRSCAKVCQVDVRTMHYAVLIFERGLQEWEKEQVASEV